MKIKKYTISYIFILLISSILYTQTDEITPTITIHAVESSLPSVLSILADESGYNIVTGPKVNSSEKITIHLEDVPIDQAIDMVVRAAGLSYEIVGNSILVANKERLNSDVGTVPHVISLKYANAEEVASLLQTITEKITLDKSGNSLLVNVSPKKLAEIESIIEDIDKPAVQIMLEAKLIEVTLSDEDKEGIDWAKLSSLTAIIAETGNPVNLGGGAVSGSLLPGGTFEVSEDGSVIETLGALTTEQIPAEMYFVRLDGSTPALSRQLNAFDVTLDFLMKNNKAEILANSQVVTLNGHHAKIAMVDVVPYLLSSGGVGGQVQVQEKEVGIKLDILPTVNTDGYITTTITPEVSSIYDFIGPDRNIPWVKKRISKTTIRVMDDQSIVIAGLISLDKKMVTYKVPLLHRIPFLGERLFTHNAEIETKTDLVIQITPKIVKDNYTGIEKNILHEETEKRSIMIDEEQKLILEEKEKRAKEQFDKLEKKRLKKEKKEKKKEERKNKKKKKKKK